MATLTVKGASRPAIVNEDIAEVLRRFSWRMQWCYATARSGGRRNRRAFRLHEMVYRLLWGFDAAEGEEIDHIDRDKLNNLDSNLRRVTPSFNRANTGRHSNNTSGFKGVHYECNQGFDRWAAQVMKDGKRIRKRFPFTQSGKLAAARFVNDCYRRHFPGVAIPNPEADHAA